MKISLIIIGYNTLSTFKILLESINKIKYNDPCEIVYVDDGSTDGSVNYFKNTTLKFPKNHYTFSKNKGRVFARRKAVEIATGDWLCFIQSNVIVDSDILNQYKTAINQKDAVAFAGKIIYESTDHVFAEYLNNSKRGINKYRDGGKICYYNLIAGNFIIKKSIFNNFDFNMKLKYYGGMELDFAYRLSRKHPDIFACKKAIVTRIRHADYKNHCLKHIEYGEYNFNHLDDNLKKEVIKYAVLLNKWKIFKILINIFYQICLKIYRINLFNLNYYIIRFGMLCSILKGYYKKN